MFVSCSDPHPHKLLVSRERSWHVWWPNTDCAASKHSHIWPNCTSPDYLLRCLACSRHFRPLLLFCFWRQQMPLDWMLDSLLCFTKVLYVILMCNQSIHGFVQSFIDIGWVIVCFEWFHGEFLPPLRPSWLGHDGRLHDRPRGAADTQPLFLFSQSWDSTNQEWVQPTIQRIPTYDYIQPTVFITIGYL